MESETGVEWIVGWFGIYDCGGVCGVRDWLGDAWVYFITFDAMWDDGIAAHIRLRSTYGGDGSELDDG